MKRISQLVNEAIEEIEYYKSCEAAYQILKYIASYGEKFMKEEAVKYDISLDNLVFLSINKHTKKYKLFVTAFFIYDYLSKKYVVQEPLFIFRWGKLYFIYSYRIDGRLRLLDEKKFLEVRRSEIRLTQIGEQESKNIISILNNKEKEEVEHIREKINSMKANELRVYTKKYLFHEG